MTMIGKKYFKNGMAGLFIKSCLLIFPAGCLTGETTYGNPVNGNPGGDLNVHQWVEKHFARGIIPRSHFYMTVKVPTILSKPGITVQKV